MAPDFQNRSPQNYRNRQLLSQLTDVPETIRGIAMLYVGIYLRRFLLPVAVLAALLIAAIFGADYLWELF